jgi:hypothetical protein
MACTSGTSPVYLVHLVSFGQPNTRDKLNRPNRPNEQDKLADFFSILLEFPVTGLWYDETKEGH